MFLEKGVTKVGIIESELPNSSASFVSLDTAIAKGRWNELGKVCAKH